MKPQASTGKISRGLVKKVFYPFAVGSLMLLSCSLFDPAWAGDGLPTDPLQGRRVFISKGCGACHALWGGGGTAGPDLGKAGTGETLMQLAGKLWNHSPQMVEKMRERRMPRRNISQDEMRDLASFLYSLNYFDEPGDLQEGKALFSRKGCIRCHQVGAAGEGVGPDLDKYKGAMSPVFLAQAMWNHGPGMIGAMGRVGVSLPKFEKKEMAHLVSYIQASGRRSVAVRSYVVPGNPEQGKSLFQQKGCGRCHPVSPGKGGIGPNLWQQPFKAGVTEITAAMWNHGPGMWAKMKGEGISFPTFSGREMSDLLAYLYFLRFLDKPGDPVIGSKVFSDKGCASCHNLPGEGGGVGPDLSKGESIQSGIAWASAMWNHAPAMEQKVEEIGMPWPRFEGDEMRDLEAYLQSQIPQANPEPAK